MPPKRAATKDAADNAPATAASRQKKAKSEEPVKASRKKSESVATTASAPPKKVAAAASTKARVTKRKASEDDAPEAPRASKKAKAEPAKAKPAEKKPAEKKTAVKKTAATKTTAAKSAGVTKKAPAKAAAKAAAKASKSASPAVQVNGEVVAPSPKAEAPEPPKEPKVTKPVDPLDIAYADPSPPLKPLHKKKAINDVVYNKPLDVFVCGEGSNAELGLGTAKKQMDVKRPRFNAFISGKNIVRLAAGGMHVLALSADGQIYSWGVNDQGALGRDTRWDGGLKDMDAASDDSDSEDEDADSGMNPLEANPAPIKSTFFHPGTTFVDIVAGDSCSFALTAEGRVYGWGTFRANEGILGFNKDVEVQRTPTLIPGLKDIKKLAAGENHVLALDAKGAVWAWGCGQQSQLGRRIIERTKKEALNPACPAFLHGSSSRSVKMADVACGSYSSFSIDKTGRAWSWGANNYGECGHFENAGEDGAFVFAPTVVDDLEKDGKPIEIAHLEGGAHHTVAVTADGEALVWGRCDGGQTGIDLATLNKAHVMTSSGLRASEVEEKEGSVETRTYKILAHPTAIPAVGKDVVAAACGSDHTIILTKQGKAWTTGFSANYQTGQGTDEDIEVATMIDNTATRDRKLVWVGAGGQYSIFAAEKKEE